MEDEGFVDDDFIEQTAREYAGRYGLNGIPMLRQRVRIAEASGDYLLAETWREIASLAEDILRPSAELDFGHQAAWQSA